MSDINDKPSEDGETPKAIKPPKKLTPNKGMAAMQGESIDEDYMESDPKENTPRKWTRFDGSGWHQVSEDAVVDAYDQTAELDDASLERQVESEYELPDGTRIDTLITKGDNALVLDYKTDDMSNWTPPHATSMGHQYGSQVQGYVAQVPQPNATGYVVICGKLPTDPAALSAFQNTLAGYNVNTAIVGGDGEADDVVDTVGDLIEENDL